MRLSRVHVLGLFVVLNSFYAHAQTQTWPGGVITHTTLPTIYDGSGGYITEYSNWVYADPQGALHSFNGSTEADRINLGGGKMRLIYTSLNAVSTDGLYTISAKGPTGAIGVRAVITPHFRVLKVDYAPPGTKSYADYGVTTVSGAKTSSTTTWTAGVKVVGTASFLGNGGNWTISSSENNSTTDSLTINKSSGWDWQFSGGPTSYDAAGDGINHDNDLITLLLNPQVIVTGSSATTCSTDYELDTRDNNVASGDMDLIYLTIGQIKSWLSDPNWSATGSLARSWAGANGGFTATDLQQILQADPFTNDPTGMNTSVNGLVASGRYTPTGGQNIVYVPTNGGVVNQTYNAYYQVITANETADTVNISAGMTFSGGIGISDWLGAKGSLGYSFEWSHQNLDQLSTDTKQVVTVSVQSPASNYTGPESIIMYQDNLYGTIMFAPAPIH